MTAGPDPFAAMPWRQRFGLRRRLRRAWRAGVSEQHAASLRRLRSELIGVGVVSVDDRSTIGEITFTDGTVVRLWLCHRPALKALRMAARDGDAVLAQVDDHGHCWALYFATLEGRLPLMSRDLRVRSHQGGASPELDPRLPAPDDRSPRLV